MDLTHVNKGVKWSSVFMVFLSQDNKMASCTLDTPLVSFDVGPMLHFK